MKLFNISELYYDLADNARDEYYKKNKKENVYNNKEEVFLHLLIEIIKQNNQRNILYICII